MITYYAGNKDVVLCFQWDKKSYFFLKLSQDELMRYDATNGQTDSYLLQKTTKVFYMESPSKVKKLDFDEI